MEGPTSAIVSEIYMQSLETTAITTADHPPKVWERHVDDVFSIVHKTYLQELVKGEDLKVDTQFKYLGDVLNSKGYNSEVIKDKVKKAVGITNEIISLCKEVNFCKNQISNMLLLNRSIFILRLIYNCETWINITLKEYASLRKSQLLFLRRALEILRSVPTAALYLELGILPIKCEIEIRQLLILKRILEIRMILSLMSIEI